MAGGWSREDLEGMDLGQALAIHLTARCFPSRMIMFKTAKEAIEACQEEDFERLIALPEKVSYHGEVKASAKVIVEHLRLEDFL